MSDVPQGEGWWQASDGRWYPPEQHPGSSGPQAGSGPGRGSGAKVLIGIVVGLALAAGAFVVLTQLDDDEAAAVLLEPIGSPGPDPFTESHAPEPAGTLRDYAAHGPPESEDGPDPIAEVAVKRGTYLTTGGSLPGLYGGTRDEAACDPDQLVEFLSAEDDKAEAWAGVLGLGVDGIPGYVDGLTPVVLGADTRVLNHGFADGTATARHSVLQRGSAVLVDDHGVPRVRCSCGNPLLPLAPADDVEETFTGDQWPAFEAEQVVVIERTAEPVEVFELVDVEAGSLFERPSGTRGDADRGPDPEAPESDPEDVEEPAVAVRTEDCGTFVPDISGGAEFDDAVAVRVVEATVDCETARQIATQFFQSWADAIFSGEIQSEAELFSFGAEALGWSCSWEDPATSGLGADAVICTSPDGRIELTEG